jgi:hypothetical protein
MNNTEQQQQAFTGASTSRLANPTAYHMQQMRYNKDHTSMGIDPSHMLDSSHLLFSRQQQQQQQQDSPNLSDLDYTELNSSPMTGEYHHHRQPMYREGDSYIFDEAAMKHQQQQQQQVYSYAVQMKRSSTEVETAALGGMTGYGPPQHNYYPYDNHNSNDGGRFIKQMAESAPSNMGFHGYSSFGGSDDMISVAASQQSSSNVIASNSTELLDETYTEDYSTQAK